MVLLTRMLTRRWRVAAIMAMALAVAATVAAQLRPPELLARAAAAGLSGPILRWCPAVFQQGRPGAFAFAMGSTQTGGRYYALDVDGPPVPLAVFEDGVDLTCYTREEANQIHAELKQSQTMAGDLQARWDATVVCGLTQHTLSVCWQFDPVNHRFVEVGRWTN